MDQSNSNGPMKGVRVIELGIWIAGPAAAGILADWGADVIKVEPPGGDPARSAMATVLGIKDAKSPPFEVDNRSKRSVVIDIQTPQGHSDMLALLETADIFITNLRPSALTRLKLDPETLHTQFPQLVIGQVTGYGHGGPDADRPGYDSGGFWAYSGLAHKFSGETGYPPILPGGFGDHLTGITLVSGLTAALYKRAQTGEGSIVETSLLKVGIYAGSMDYALKLGRDFDQRPPNRAKADAPLVNNYRTSDDRVLWLLCVEGPRHWPNILKALDLEKLAIDERFKDMHKLYKNRRDLIAVFDQRFAEKTLAEWSEILDENDVWWSPVQTIADVVDSPQAASIGVFPKIPGHEDAPRTVASPIDFNREHTKPRGSVPELGADTEAVLAELRQRS